MKSEVVENTGESSFGEAQDGFLVILSFYRKVVKVPGPGTIESYDVIGGDI
jgi:hypothetical protein